jgi:hypothetical protein
MSNSRVKTFYIPLSYEVSSIQRVQADSLEKAIDLVLEGEGVDVNDPNYISGSTVIDDDLITSSQVEIDKYKFVRVSLQSNAIPDFIGYIIDIDQDGEDYIIIDENSTEYQINLDDVFPLTEDEISSGISDKLKQIVSSLK